MTTDSFSRTARILVLVVALTSAISLPAHSSEHKRPTAALFSKGALLQTGYVQESCWNDHRAGEVRRKCVDRVVGWPEVDEVQPGQLRVRLSEQRRPHRVDLGAWPFVDENGYPWGPYQELDYRLRRAEKGWRIYFDAPTPCRSYYITLDVTWEDEPEPEFVAWNFHVETGLAAGLPHCVS